MTDLKKYAEGVKLPVRYNPLNRVVRDANNLLIVDIWGHKQDTPSLSVAVTDAFGNWLAEQINKGLEEVKG